MQQLNGKVDSSDFSTAMPVFCECIVTLCIFVNVAFLVDLIQIQNLCTYNLTDVQVEISNYL